MCQKYALNYMAKLRSGKSSSPPDIKEIAEKLRVSQIISMLRPNYVQIAQHIEK